MKNYSLRSIIFLTSFLLVAILFVSLPKATASAILVNSNADTLIDSDGNCTLREALENANTNSETTGGGL